MLKWLEGLLIAGIAALAPIHAVMITVGVLIVFDLITGVIVAIKLNQGISSARLRDTVSKAVIYQIAVISGFLVQKFLLNDTIPVSSIIAGAIGLTELKSVLENLNIISGNDLLKLIISKIGSVNQDNSQDKP